MLAVTFVQCKPMQLSLFSPYTWDVAASSCCNSLPGESQGSRRREEGGVLQGGGSSAYARLGSFGMHYITSGKAKGPSVFYTL